MIALRAGQATYERKQFVGSHPGHDEKIANNDIQIIGTATAQGSPNLFDFSRVLIGKLKQKHKTIGTVQCLRVT